MKSYDVVIIGAGTAGLSARREVIKSTNHYVVIDPGPLGTTCARVGCMPSKVMIEAAHQFHQRNHFAKFGIQGAEQLTLSRPEFMDYVRRVRDRFVRGVTGEMDDWTMTHLIRRKARFTGPKTLDLGDETITAEKFILATGSTPIVPPEWLQQAPDLQSRLHTTDGFFELKDLPDRVAVIGLGSIGLELSQALAKIGVEVHGFTRGPAIGGLTDPEIQAYVAEKIADEFPLSKGGVDKVSFDGEVCVQSQGKTYRFDAALVGLGRKPNLEGLGLEHTGAMFQPPLFPGLPAIPKYHADTFRIDHTDIYLVGDVNGDRPILHEASDQGRIAGYNAVQDKDHRFKKRTRLAITFSSPQIALIGKSYRELTESGADFAVGRVSFEGQGRAIIMLEEKGLLKVYGDRKTGRLLGAELCAPAGEHLAHLLAWAIESHLTVKEALARPFYHPVVEEGLRTALRGLAGLINKDPSGLELMRCEDPPVGVFAR